jgi:hypothetical protein
MNEAGNFIRQNCNDKTPVASTAQGGYSIFPIANEDHKTSQSTRV